MDCTTGTGAPNNLVGNGSNQCIKGKGGNDTLEGRGGNDTLTGGSGADRFVFQNITRVRYLGGKKYRVRTNNQGTDLIKDFNPDAGDVIINGNQEYNLGNIGGNPGTGTPPGGNGTVVPNSFSSNLSFQPFLAGGTFPPGSSIRLGITQKNTAELSTFEDPKLPFEVNNTLRLFEGIAVAVFEITPTSQYKFEKEVDIVSTPVGRVLKKSIEINEDSSSGFNQVVIILQDTESPSDILAEGSDQSDELVGTRENEIFAGLGGDDNIKGKGGDDIIAGGADDDTLAGNNGNDSVYGNTGEDKIFGGIGHDVLNGGDNKDTLKGGSGNDALFGWTGNDRLLGNDGDDFLGGEFGSDTLNGGAGSDTLQGGGGNDRINGGPGIDLLIERGASYKLTDTRLIEVEIGQDMLRSVENVYLIGIETDDDMDASQFTQGKVTLEGGEGSDTLSGGAEDDLLRGEEGDDSIQGGQGDDIAIGGEGNDLLIGDAGDDILDGVRRTVNQNNIGAGGIPESGTNSIDTLTGGDGGDLFVLGGNNGNFYDDQILSPTNDGRDDYGLITDFQSELDTIVLTGSQTYSLQEITVDGVAGTGIFENQETLIDLNGNFVMARELIGLVAGVNAASLSINVGAELATIGAPLI